MSVVICSPFRAKSLIYDNNDGDLFLYRLSVQQMLNWAEQIPTQNKQQQQQQQQKVKSMDFEH